MRFPKVISLFKKSIGAWKTCAPSFAIVDQYFEDAVIIVEILDKIVKL